MEQSECNQHHNHGNRAKDSRAITMYSQELLLFIIYVLAHFLNKGKKTSLAGSVKTTQSYANQKSKG